MAPDRLTVHVATELQHLIPRFLAHRRNEVAQLHAALARADTDAVRRIGHGMKGVGSGYGFDEVTRLGAQIEQHAKAGDTEELAHLIDELARYLDRVEVVFD